jgi:hypothetical protein
LLHKDPRVCPGPLRVLHVLAANCRIFRVGLPGLEPGTSSLSEKRSNRLSYRPKGSREFAAGLMYNTEVSLTS